MKQIEVQILQQSYLLTCPDGRESRLLDAVERVDTAMVRIRDSGKVRARERIAVLAALNLAFEIADREALDLAAASTKKAAALGSAPGSSPEAELPAQDTQQLYALVARLDEALDDEAGDRIQEGHSSEGDPVSEDSGGGHAGHAGDAGHAIEEEDARAP